MIQWQWKVFTWQEVVLGIQQGSNGLYPGHLYAGRRCLEREALRRPTRPQHKLTGITVHAVLHCQITHLNTNNNTITPNSDLKTVSSLNSADQSDLYAVLELVSWVVGAFAQQFAKDDDLLEQKNSALFAARQNASVLLPNTESLLLQQLPLRR